ncbi:MAG: pilus assembly protein [Betaproteobacteria bacterium]|nr:pilus assembly protein [Betaproteobacteria bacterium]
MLNAIHFSWRDRLRACAVHFFISAIIAVVSALFVFVFWYPDPYREISGGRELFLILVSVDVILGPLITLSIFNRAKPWLVLRRDLVCVGVVQLVALGYGMWTAFVARPVHLVFEYDRFRVVHAIEVPKELLAQAPPELRTLPPFGTTVLALRPFRDADEKFNTTMAALQGLPLGARPDLWQPYPDARIRVIESAKPAVLLKKRFPDRAADIDQAIERTGRAPDAVLYLPLVGRKVFWTVLLDSSTAEVLGFLPLDSF